MLKKKTICAVLLMALMGTLAMGCGQNQEAPQDNQQQAEDQQPTEKEEWILAINATFPPFETIDEAEGNAYVGIDIDIANYIAEQMGITFTISDMAFNGLVNALNSGHADIIISGISPTEERKKTCDFTNSYFYPQTAILTMKDSPYTTLESLEGKQIGCSMGTTYANQAAKVQDAVVKEYDSTPLVVQEIVNGRIEAGLFDSYQAGEFVKNNDQLAMYIIPGTLVVEDSYAIALPKGSPYVEQINAILQEMEENGKMDEIFAKWLGEGFVDKYNAEIAALKAELANAEAPKDAEAPAIDTGAEGENEPEAE